MGDFVFVLGQEEPNVRLLATLHLYALQVSGSMVLNVVT